MSENSFELITEYKDQIRILRQEVAELQDAGKSKDAANKRCLQKLEHTNDDLEKANQKIKELENKLNKIGEDHDQKDKREDKKSLGQIYCLAFQLAEMKFTLALIMCSYVAGECMPPFLYDTKFDNQYDCLMKGYEESISKIKEIGEKDINEHEIYIRFVCTAGKAEEEKI